MKPQYWTRNSSMVALTILAWNNLVRGANSWTSAAAAVRGGGMRSCLLTGGTSSGRVRTPFQTHCRATAAAVVLEETEGSSAALQKGISKRQGSGTSSSSSSSNSAGTRILVDHSDFITPERDPRKYRAIQLSNNLQVLLVCDEMSAGVGVEAASVHVQAGHFDDTIPGLARKLRVFIFLLSVVE